MPVTNNRQSLDWQARFNRSVIAILGPTLAEQGFQVSLDQVTEDVEPDSYGPFYVGEVGFTRPLSDGWFAHLVVQSTLHGTGSPDAFYVDILRLKQASPPDWDSGPATGGPAGTVIRRISRPAGGGQGWRYGSPDDLRAHLSELRDHLIEPQAGPVPGTAYLTWIQDLPGAPRSGT